MRLPAGWSRRAVTEALGWRPEWPVAVLVAVAWLLHLIHEVLHGGQPHAATGRPLIEDLPGWTVMSVAMMVPATLPAVRHVAINSLRVRRRRAVTIYTGAYVGVWVAFGIVVLGLVAIVRGQPVVNDQFLLAVALAGAAAWQLTPWKRRALFACRRTVPLPPVGWKADAACLRYAAQQGRRCVQSCWPIMAVIAIAGHVHLLGMVVLSALVVIEELPLIGWRWARRAAAGLAVAALFVAAGI